MSRFSVRTALLGVLLAAVTAVPAEAGPPWVTLEYPANPLDRETRGALFVVHTYRHQAPLGMSLQASAEGIVAGQQRSHALEIRQTSRPGVYAVYGTLDGEGSWVVSVEVGGGEATLLAAIRRGGMLTAVRVPYGLQDGWVVPRTARADERRAMLETALAAAPMDAPLRVAAGAGEDHASGPFAPLLLAFGILAVPAAGYAVRRRRHD